MFGIENLSSLQYGNYEKIRNVRLNQNQEGYNGDFIYPSGTQGAKAIPEKLSEGVNIEYNTELISLNLNKNKQYLLMKLEKNLRLILEKAFL